MGGIFVQQLRPAVGLALEALNSLEAFFALDSSNQTRSTLMLRLQEGNDNEAWAEFVEIYTPVVYGLAKRQRLQDADASDVTQEFFGTIAKSIHEAAREP